MTVLEPNIFGSVHVYFRHENQVNSFYSEVLSKIHHISNGIRYTFLLANKKEVMRTNLHMIYKLHNQLVGCLSEFRI